MNTNRSYLFGYKEVPKTMPKKELVMLLNALREIRRSATFKLASFKDLKVIQDNPARSESTVKEVTSPFRRSWIIDPLDEIIERYENYLED